MINTTYCVYPKSGGLKMSESLGTDSVKRLIESVELKLPDKLSKLIDEEYTILVVDDEEMVTTSISTLLMLETDYNVLTFNSPSKALKEIEAEKIDLVISNYLMPGEMNGIEFLLKVKELQPDAIRILLTAYADKENAIRGIREVGLYQYVKKPWDNNALILLIHNGLHSRNQ